MFNKFIYKIIQKEKKMQSGNGSQMFGMLKMRFPNLDLQIVNPEVSFAENLQNIIDQIERPHNMKVNDEIISMKDAVDNQELKIQRNLVNEEPVLQNITNQTIKYQSKGKKIKCIYEYEQFDQWEGMHAENIMDDIWEMGSSQPHKDWFNH